MKWMVYTCLLLMPGFVQAQMIEKYYTYDWKETHVNSARFYSVIVKEDSIWHRSDYYVYEKKLQMNGYYADSNCKVRHGLFHFYHANGQLASTGEYFFGRRHGTWTSYHSNGMMMDSATYEVGVNKGVALAWNSSGYLVDSAAWNTDGSSTSVSWFDDGTPSAAGRRNTEGKKHGTWQYFHRNGLVSAKEVYRDGALVSKEYFNEKGEPADTNNVDKPATFPGGLAAWQEFVTRQVYFPDGYKIVNADRIVVVVEGVIDEDGRMTEVEVNTSFHPAFDHIAVSMMKRSPKWKPAIQHNRKMKYKVRQAVYFAQDEDD